MLNAVSELVTQKTSDQYKIIEDRYLTLKRFITLWFENYDVLRKDEAEIIVKALDNSPVTAIKLVTNEVDNDENEEV